MWCFFYKKSIRTVFIKLVRNRNCASFNTPENTQTLGIQNQNKTGVCKKRDEFETIETYIQL